MNKRLFKRAGFGVAAAGAAALLASCGGGGGSAGGNPDPFVSGTQVPVSATTSADGAFAFVSGVVASSSETSDPLTLGDVTLATSDTTDPTAF